VTLLEIVATGGFALVLALLFVRPQLGIVALIAFYPLVELVPRMPLPGMNAETALFVGAGAVTLMRFGPRLPPLRYSAPFVVFVMVMLMSWGIGAVQAVAIDPWELFKIWKSATFPCLFFLFAYWWIVDERSRRHALEAITWSVGVVAITGLVDSVAPFSASGLQGRAAGVLDEPNNMGGLLAAFSLVALPLIGSRELGWLRRAAYLAVYLLALAVTVLTLSRGAWLGMLAGHAVVLILARPAWLLAGLLAGAILLPSSYPFFPERVRERIEETFEPQRRVFRGGAERFGSGAERIVFYQIGYEMFLESPIWGQGMESFLVRSKDYGARYGLLSHRAPHSLVVKLASETGLIGLSMLAWLGLAVGAVGFSLWRGRPEARRLGLTLLAVTGSIAASNLVHDTFTGHHVFGGLFWMLFGSAARLHFDSRRGEIAVGEPPEPARLPRWLVGRELRYAPPVLAQRSPGSPS
jgi:O-antigen ligase